MKYQLLKNRIGLVDGTTYTLTITDAHTGKQHTRSYDSYGKLIAATDDTGAPVAQLASLDDFHQNIQQTFVNAALANGAAASKWEVQTIDAQHQIAVGSANVIATSMLAANERWYRLVG